MSAALARLLDALRTAGCTVTQGGSAATCPAHDDRAPSLSIGRRRDGDGVLVRCHAGCPTEDVLGALNLTAADLFDHPRQKSTGRPQIAVTYPYTDEDGTMLFEKVRYMPKDFRLRRPDGAGGWIWRLDDVRRVPYRLPEVVAAIEKGERIYVCEGEKDADALAEAGVTATTWPEGAWTAGTKPKWRGEYTSTLTGADVVVVADRDEPGRHTAATIEGLLAGTAASVAVVEPAEGKDGADHLAAGRTVAELVPLDLADENTTGDDRPPEPEADKGKVPAATRLVRLAEDRYRLGCTPTGEPFAVPLTSPPMARMLRGGSVSLRADLAEAFWVDTGRAPAQQALADALMVLEGRAAHGDTEELHLRVAEHKGALWLDLGDDTGRAVRVTSDGWEVGLPPVLFRRTTLTGPLPEPVRGGSLAELWPLLNVTEGDRPVVLAVLVAELLPKIPHPVVSLGGEQGTGKSSAARVLSGLLDPSPAQLRKAPRDSETWTVAAAGSWVVAVDNLSGLPDWFSDALCRASTGDGDVRRRLYADNDLFVFAFRRCIYLTGIDLGAVRDDLADRLVVIDLDRITKRKEETALDAEWAAAHPRVLGALLDLAAKVLGVLPDVALPDPPRMADFARVLAAVDLLLGTEGIERYRGQANALAADAVAGDPVLAALTERVTGPWEGTAAELLDRISGDGERSGRDWPKTARALTGTLRRRAPSLRRVGWTVDDLGRQGKQNAVKWRLAPPSTEASDGERQASDRRATASDRADARLVARLDAPRVTCEDVEMASEASDASVEYPESLCSSLNERERGGIDTAQARLPESVARHAATLASPADDRPRCRCGNPLHEGRCIRCEVEGRSA